MNTVRREKVRVPKRRQRLVTAVISFAVVMSALLATLLLIGPGRLEPDEIVQECGIYVSPGREYHLVVTESADQTICLTLEPLGTWHDIPQRFIRYLRGVKFPITSRIAAERDWMLCFDEFDRLWVFTGRGHGEPSAPQEVTMHGFFFNRNGLLHGGYIVRSAEDWTGVPPQFFKRIPAKDDPAAWGEDPPPFPAYPADFSRAERLAAASRRR